MQRRAETAEETRRRIIAATYELHAQRGVAATSVRDIAARADVSVGTVYHHFPTYDDVITACGAHVSSIVRPPGVEIFSGLTTPARRLDALVRALFASYERYPFYDVVRADRGKFAALDAALAADEEHRRALVRAALGPSVGKRLREVIFALVDFSVWRNLREAGLSQSAACDEIIHILQQRMRRTS